MDWLEDAQWLLWVALAVVAGTVELVTLDLIFLMVAGGAFVAAVTAAVGAPVAVQIVAFAVSTALLLFVARPPLRRYSDRAVPESLMHTAALVGREAEVLVEVTHDTGRVKLGGEVWTARAARRGLRLEVGSPARVVRIDGATAVVTPLTLSAGDVEGSVAPPPAPLPVESPSPPDPSDPGSGPDRGR